MYNFRQRMARFMAGRYGIDSLYSLILIICVILAIVNIFARSWIIWLAMLLLAAWATFRAMSRNIYKRQRENAFILKIKGKLTFLFGTAKQRFKERKTHVYKKCPQCRAQLRLPRKKGKLKVHCPKCGGSFEIKIK